jgi:hypothetical protein
MSRHSAPFRPDSVDRFRITSFEVDPKSTTAVLRYALDDKYHFEERVDFGRAGRRLSPGKEHGLDRVVRLLHLVAGVSYYKTAAPRRIVVETGTLTRAEMRLCYDIYDRGMREFAYRNGLTVPMDLEISASSGQHESRGESRGGSHDESRPAISVAEAPEPGIAVPIGGGKDSIVVLEALKPNETKGPKDSRDPKHPKHLRPLLVSVNPNPAVERIASISGLDLARIRRTLDPHLLDLNERGALNGHVPVTAIVSLLSVAGGYLYGYDTTAIALESSADVPTRVLGEKPDGADVNGVDVNHQWSKSAEFEVQLQQVLHESVHESIRFFSPLRMFTELEITGAFATLTPYLSAFRSCNRASRMSAPVDGWCLACPKCRFVFLALATVLARGEVTEIFGADLLDDDAQADGFFDMLDARRKPFECVGTVEEVAQALRQLLADPAWSGAAVIERIRPAVEELPVADRRVHASAGEVFAGVRGAMAKAALT